MLRDYYSWSSPWHITESDLFFNAAYISWTTDPALTCGADSNTFLLHRVALRVGSNPELLEGDEVILMLAKADFLHGMARGDSRPKYTIVGMAQGTYYLSRDRGVAFRDYAQLAIVPRPDLKPAQNPPATKEVLGAEIERLREAQK